MTRLEKIQDMFDELSDNERIALTAYVLIEGAKKGTQFLDDVSREMRHEDETHYEEFLANVETWI